LLVSSEEGIIMFRMVSSLNDLLISRRKPPALSIDKFDNYLQYTEWLEYHPGIVDQKLAEEERLIPRERGDTVKGYCFICRAQRQFKVDFNPATGKPNWRETLLCPECGFWTRIRAVMQILDSELVITKGHSIYITEYSTPFYRYLSGRFPKLVGSEFLSPDLEPGFVEASGRRHEDLTRLSFADDEYDFVLSFEVFEHVPDYPTALRECYRCLKPGGKLVFTVPFTASFENTLIRATVNPNGSIHHIHPPEIHGDPLRPEGCLSFYQFGWDLLNVLRSIGFTAYAVRFWSRELCLIGRGGLFAFVAVKY
jgi:SAM-dependent methyltransferase